MIQSRRPADIPAINPITLEVLRGRLNAVADEMQLIILKSSHSSIVSESLDATSAIFDRRGRTVAQAVSLPIHLGVLVGLGRRFAEKYPEGVAQPGDVYVINDPYSGGTHLPDIAVAAPVFHQGQLVGYAATMTHHQDVGGAAPGSVVSQVRDHFAEGLRIPMIRLSKAGVRNEDVFELMFANTRMPGNMRGDLNGQIAAASVGSRRLAELYGESGADLVEAGIDALMDYAERLTRLEIEAIPDGEYSFTDYLDDDGSSPDTDPVRICVRMTVRGSTIHFDFDGTAPQVAGAINNVPASTLSTIYYVVRTLTGDAAPNNDGCYRPISYSIPVGTLLNPAFPAPVAARSVALRRVVDAVMGAMSQAVPSRMTAANCGQTSLIPVGTFDAATGRRIVATIGGPWMGGSGARANKDGIDVTDHDASNVFHMPIESSEAELPILFHRVELWEDSGGAGQFRGGLGFHSDVEWLRGDGTAAIRRDRHKFAPWGLKGGQAAPKCRTTLHRAGRQSPLASKCLLQLQPGDHIELWTGGGGGYGSPLLRDAELVREDVLDGRVSREAAEQVYGVILRDDEVDRAGTESRRARLSAQAVA